jgi:hypothetical protein
LHASREAGDGNELLGEQWIAFPFVAFAMALKNF